jgi:hypothetical protein
MRMKTSKSCLNIVKTLESFRMVTLSVSMIALTMTKCIEVSFIANGKAENDELPNGQFHFKSYYEVNPIENTVAFDELYPYVFLNQPWYQLGEHCWYCWWT